MREEHVDGGYLVTLGTYMGTEDYSKPVVRQLQVSILASSGFRMADDLGRLSVNWRLSGAG
jgi:hypothetical protein